MGCIAKQGKKHSIPPAAASFLRPGVTLEQLERQAHRLSDNDSAARLLRERKKLFKPILARLISTD